jgi:hypothetical protein
MTLHQHVLVNAPRSPASTCSERAVPAEVPIRNGVEFTLALIEPGLWRWRFQIGEIATTGTTKTNLRGMAAHRVKSRIDRELNKSRKLAK